MTARVEIVDEARKWLGVRWRHQGRTEHGIDCVGLVLVVAHELGLSDYEYSNYTRRPDGTFLSHFAKVGDRVPRTAPQLGDIAAFRDGAYPCHAGLFGTRHGRLTMIHAHSGRRKVVEEIFANELPEMLVAVYQFRGLE